MKAKVVSAKKAHKDAGCKCYECQYVGMFGDRRYCNFGDSLLYSTIVNSNCGCTLGEKL